MGRTNNPNIYLITAPIAIEELLKMKLRGKALKAYESDPEKRREIEKKLGELTYLFTRKVSDELNEMFAPKKRIKTE